MACLCEVCGSRCDCGELLCPRCVIEVIEKENKGASASANE